MASLLSCEESEPTVEILLSATESSLSFLPVFWKFFLNSVDRDDLVASTQLQYFSSSSPVWGRIKRISARQTGQMLREPERRMRSVHVDHSVRHLLGNSPPLDIHGILWQHVI
jgi:hypothetical protein